MKIIIKVDAHIYIYIFMWDQCSYMLYFLECLKGRIYFFSCL